MYSPNINVNIWCAVPDQHHKLIRMQSLDKSNHNTQTQTHMQANIDIVNVYISERFSTIPPSAPPKLDFKLHEKILFTYL